MADSQSGPTSDDAPPWPPSLAGAVEAPPAAAPVALDVPPIAVAVSPSAPLQLPIALSPTAVSHRHPHDTYAVITPVSSPKRSGVSSAPVADPAPAASTSPRSRPHLNLNLLAVGVARPTSARALVPSSNGRIRKVTRDIAALDFLQNIPMLSECSHLSEHSRKLGPLSSPDHDAQSQEYPLELDEVEQSLAGRRLPGPDSTVVNVLPLFRYRLTTKYPAASAVVRRWEATMTEKGVIDGRVFLSSGKGYPVGVSSVIKYNGTEKVTRAGGRKRLQSIMISTEPYDWRGKSYFRLLHSTWSRCDKDRDSQDSHPIAPLYDPNFLDNPEYRQGRHKDVIRGDRKVGPVVSSILRFVKPNDLKEELNKQFRETHLWLDDSELTLSKIRNLKQEALAMGSRTHLDISTIALACVYFEKLVLSNFVHKANRKLYMSACLILALKFNEPLNRDGIVDVIKKLLVEIDHVHSLPSRDVLTAEFTVYAQLSFALHVPLQEIQPHFARLLRLVESNPRQYLGEETFTSYSKLLHEEKIWYDSVAAADHSYAEDDDDDEEEEEDGTDLEGADDDDARDHSSLFPWNRVSFAQWWKDRT